MNHGLWNFSRETVILTIVSYFWGAPPLFIWMTCFISYLTWATPAGPASSRWYSSGTGRVHFSVLYLSEPLAELVLGCQWKPLPHLLGSQRLQRGTVVLDELIDFLLRVLLGGDRRVSGLARARSRGRLCGIPAWRYPRRWLRYRGLRIGGGGGGGCLIRAISSCSL